MERKSIHSIQLLGAMLCVILAMWGLPVSVSASETSYSSTEVTQDHIEQDMLLATEDSITLETVADDDCITFSSVTRLQLATMSLEETWDGTMKYSTDKINWSLWDGGFINSAEAEDGMHYIYVRGDNNTVVSGGTTWALMKPDGDAAIFVSGNIETLRGAIGDQPATTPMGNDCYGGMFKDDQWLASAPELTATTLAKNCYMQMFQNCISLTQAPELPADILCKGCYQYMFRGCNGLTTAPELPATVLAESCYSHMFEACYYLQSAPDELPASDLTPNCYQYMFIDCIRLETAPKISATELAESCCEGMFVNCSKLKSAPELPVEELAKNCYCGMFTNCTELQDAPELPANELVEGCYSEMFLSCQSLTAPVDISHVTELANYCCYRMYEGCINMGVYKEAQPGYTKEWRATSATETVGGWNENMFQYTYGDFTGNPVIGTTYYLADNAPITHTAIADDAEGGFIRIHQKYFIPGKIVEAEAVPYTGYVTTSFVARDVNGEEFPIVDAAFTMPDSDVTIVATFKLDFQQCNVSGISESYVYTGEAIEPVVTVDSADTTLTLGNDYTVSYENNIDVGTATVTVTGIGDYAGTISTTFDISKAIITITPKDGQHKTVGKEDPVLVFEATGAKANEVVATSGSLVRAKGEKVGTYAITQGTLALADNGTFKASNYELKFSETQVLFTIKSSEIKVVIKDNPPVKTSDDNSVALFVCMALAALGLAAVGIKVYVTKR